MAFFWAEEPEPEMSPLAQLIAGAELLGDDEAVLLLLLEPQAATPSSDATAMPATAD
jgi:hypothetical protein